MKPLRVLINKNPLYDKCPSCGEYGTLHRSRPRGVKEELIKTLTFFKPFRCRTCGWRGFRTMLTITRESLRTLLIYTIVVVIAALVVKTLISRLG